MKAEIEELRAAVDELSARLSDARAESAALKEALRASADGTPGNSSRVRWRHIVRTASMVAAARVTWGVSAKPEEIAQYSTCVAMAVADALESAWRRENAGEGVL